MVAEPARIPGAFPSSHPAVLFAWFLGALTLTILVSDPLWQAVAFAGAASFCLCTRGRSGWKTVAGMLPLFAALALANGFFNPRGATVLFTYLGRPYTLEALLYGAQAAAMFVSVMLLFGSWNRVMTADALMFLFGSRLPALTMVLTMALRLVPAYLHKARRIAWAQAGIGQGAGEGSVVERVRHGSGILGALTTWALEAGIVTADSMRSRGYGSGLARTQFAQHRFTIRDGAVLAAMALLTALAFAGVIQGAASMEYLPRIVFPETTAFGVVAFLGFTGFLFLPTALDMKARISWRRSLSRI